MIDVQVQMNEREVRSFFGQLRSQVPFAASKAVNDTVLEVQQAIRDNVARRFTLREPRFILRTVKIPYFSRKSDEVVKAVIQIDPNRPILAKFEAGGVKAGTPDTPVAIPSENLRPNPLNLVPRSLYPTNLRLVPRRGVKGILAPKRHTTMRGVVQLKGKRRTFVLDPATMFGVKTWGVYQRFGPGKHDVKLLWVYKSRIPIPATLQFEQTARRVSAERFESNYIAALQYAMGTIRV